MAEATPTALLLNVVGLFFAAVNYWRGKLINWGLISQSWWLPSSYRHWARD